MKEPNAPNEYIQTISDHIDELETYYQQAKILADNAENILMDIDHEIELLDLDDAQLLERARTIRDARRTRREAKDALEMLTPIMQTLDRTGVKRGVEQALREANQVLMRQARRTYAPRVRTAEWAEARRADTEA